MNDKVGFCIGVSVAAIGIIVGIFKPDVFPINLISCITGGLLAGASI